jgi:hypothetical protein
MGETKQVMESIFVLNTFDSYFILIVLQRPGADAKPGAKIRQTSASDVNIDENIHKNRERYPDTQSKKGAGGYFGGKFDFDGSMNSEHAKNQKEAREKIELSRDSRRDIESQLNSELLLKIQNDDQHAAEEIQNKLERWKRYEISRQYAYPVERIIETYENNESDLYDVIGIWKILSTCSFCHLDHDKLKHRYHKLALLVHPGNN